MKIVIATPLYPPDLAEPAPYVKELATRLKDSHDVTVVLYGRLPEEIPEVTLISIDKRDWLLKRLLRYLITLFKAAKKADVIYCMNGASVEIAVTFVSFLRRIPFVLYLGDADSKAWVESQSSLKLIQKLATKQAAKVVDTLPPPRPEILPFREPPLAAQKAYNQEWQSHLEKLSAIMSEVTA